MGAGVKRAAQIWLLVLGVGLGTVVTALPAQADGRPMVAVSVAPIHALVANVMAGIGEPMLLLPPGASPHTFALRPSDAAAIDRADVVFWVGEALETSLARPLAALAADARLVALIDAPGVTVLPLRRGGLWEASVHEDHDSEQGLGAGTQDDVGGHDHRHGQAHEEMDRSHAVDAHIWLSLENARAMVRDIVEVLSDVDPEHAARYRENGAAYDKELEILGYELAAALSPVRSIPFIVFHDAFQYFERSFGLNGVGSLTVSPDQKPGARRLQEIRDRIAALGAVCVFREPQFDPGLVRTVVAGTDAEIGAIDPLGTALAPGPGLYKRLMRDLADGVKNCLVRVG